MLVVALQFGFQPEDVADDLVLKISFLVQCTGVALQFGFQPEGVEYLLVP